ncbi:MAG TPA: NUDIX hydrolase [Candidatus Enterococcus avicola]|uniref:NUDIX hydrolase n=1 Tax=Candidatus Enterococcus avicola TaxID=2838561 RepID=A0A9D2JHZ4_9ENTE|nr:NUDIX hydrolase [Candidatus Enterococcus avicola]
MSVPTFGEKNEGMAYKARHGAYVVIADEQNEKIILVQAPNGAYFLPGGEIELGENHLETINREMLEELGYEVEVTTYFGEALEYFYSRHRDTYYEHPGYFYRVGHWRKVAEPTEKTNVLAWVTPTEALQLLKRGSHRWAIEQWLQQNKKEI